MCFCVSCNLHCWRKTHREPSSTATAVVVGMVGPQPYITARSEMLLRGSEGDYLLADVHQVAATLLKVAEEARVSESIAVRVQKRHRTFWDINGHDKINLRLAGLCIDPEADSASEAA